MDGIGGAGGTYTDCENHGKIEGAGSIAGIIGDSGSATNCKNYEEIRGTNNRVGGISGYTSYSINKCVNYGKVIGPKWVGGIAGQIGGTVVNCYNNGEIGSTEGEIISTEAIGGIGGYNAGSKYFINCFNIGTIKGTKYIGGILGQASFTQNDTSKIINCYNIGELVGTQYVGEILGDKTGYGTHYIINCFGLDRGNPVYNGTTTNGHLSVENAVAYDETYMKSTTLPAGSTETETFIDKLNGYVTTYNALTEEEKAGTLNTNLETWVTDTTTSYPVFSF